ncbi:MAG: 2OG-Fe(II) oxygenase [Pseudomonas sp.]|uniref:2OG-Fe(II) oxygenase n=1 Tax=Pseudomonas sp. TaxID=306 RepID=UPI003D6ED3E5
MKAVASHDSATTLDSCDWASIERSLDAHGNAVLPGLLTAGQCAALAELYPQEEGYRARIVMARHGFGRGEYKYFAYPLPPLLDQLRHAFYPRLAPIANDWNLKLGINVQYPGDLATFLKRCHEAGQTRPTPLILEYGEGDYNCLHQDLYGDHVFPFQVIFLLNEPGREFEGGELLLTESDPKKPGRAEVVPLRQGDAVVLAVNHRPVRSTRGYYRVSLRHGVSQLIWGQRHTLGIIFHDAK